MTQAKQSGTFGFYVVDPNILSDMEGQTLFDLVTEISALTSLQWDDKDDPLTLILKPIKEEDEDRIDALVGLLFNVLGIADSQELEESFAWKETSQ